MKRVDHRQSNQLRPLHFQRQYTTYAEGSVLTTFGNTRVLCNATITEGVPKFMKDSGKGWLTAEYGMLPRATHERSGREAARGKQGGRTLEIQRLIGRSLRAVIDLSQLGNYTIILDCDVIQADGGTRCAAISGSCVAVIDALNTMQRHKKLIKDPLKGFIAAVSVGIKNGTPVLDLDYSEDSTADTDMNVVMNDQGQLIEIQGTAEHSTFSRTELNQLLDLAESGIQQIIQAQKEALA